MNRLRDGVWVALIAGAVIWWAAPTTWGDQGEAEQAPATPKVERAAVAKVGALVKPLGRSTTAEWPHPATELLVDPGMIGRGGGSCDSPALCDGDVNGDALVDPLDTGAILARFGLDPCSAGNCQYDVNCDGLIDPLDTGYVLARFGACGPPVDCSTPGCGLSNDDCQDAIVVGEGVTPFDTTDATDDGPADCDPFTGNQDIWFEFLSPGDGNAIISLCENTAYDSTLSVYNGSGCPVGAPLACSDDDCGQVGGPSIVTVAVTDGQVLKMRVGGWDDDSGQADPAGEGELNIAFAPGDMGACCFPDETCSEEASELDCNSKGGEFEGLGTLCTPGLCVAGPPNDHCQDVTPVLLPVGGTLTFFGDNTGATSDCNSLVEEVWEAFTTELNGLTVIIDYCGSEPTHTPAYIIIETSCPCSGNPIFADSSSFEVCAGGDTNIIIEYGDLAAGTYYVPVYSKPDEPDGGTIGPYVMNLSASFPSGDCCVVHPQPGCDNVCGEPDDGGVEECVCLVDDFCCNVTWDAACVEIVGLFSCADCSDNNPDCIAPSDCCDGAGGDPPGCDDPACEALVCSFDPFCCDAQWDGLCAGEANTCCETCGGDPSDPLCEPAKACGQKDAGSCCVANGTPGCDDEFCCLSICPIDPSCCDTEWTQACADQAVALCDDACP